MIEKPENRKVGEEQIVFELSPPVKEESSNNE